ncbi:hypothetical protein SHL15_5638 [Streptomyces hygroscopicus subsp. limoneus]|nr:hypothetical protein SHL15_5638 [Streptomyces hygroscopicus subsp. limoneus]
MAVAARHLDGVHEQLTDAAQRAASTLTRVAIGKSQINSLGILQNSATQIDILTARRADAVERLKEVLHAYRRVTALDDTNAFGTLRRPGQTRRNAPLRVSFALASPHMGRRNIAGNSRLAKPGIARTLEADHPPAPS